MKEIIKELIDNGYEAYIIGGYVRDYLLGISTTDIDICTNAPINKIMSIFKGRGTAFKEYYAFHIEENGMTYDITSFRKELKYRRNKPTEIVPAKDLSEDLLRRDFTINTFALDKDGKLIDILGAKRDLNSRLIRVVGDTEKKLSEDKTRVLRAIRFACSLDFDLDPEILNFIASKQAHLLSEIPREYVKKELDKIFDSGNSYVFFYLVNRYNLHKYFNVEFDTNVKETYNRYGVWAQIEADLPFTNEERKTIDNIRKLVNQRDIYFMDIVNYTDDEILNASSILGLMEKVKVIKDVFKLHSVIDIDLDLDTMFRYINLNDFKKVYRDIERNIMEGYLLNSRDAIEDYLRNL